MWNGKIVDHIDKTPKGSVSFIYKINNVIFGRCIKLDLDYIYAKMGD